MVFKTINIKLVIISNLKTLNILQAVIEKVWNKGENGVGLI